MNNGSTGTACPFAAAIYQVVQEVHQATGHYPEQITTPSYTATCQGGGNSGTITAPPIELACSEPAQELSTAIQLPMAAQTTAPSSGPAAANDPLGALTAYWNLIAAGQYQSAWGQLAPGAGQTESAFVSGERQAGITGASFTGHVSANDGSTATVQVDGLITHDHQFGCRSWTGTYELVHQDSRWLIERASITPAACS